ncbi:MAG TPA: carbohydrate ABC transporter permease [Clostridiales bacterium]|nr:carbohydrate ABC transporter permease [Clostridiales bacterium]
MTKKKISGREMLFQICMIILFVVLFIICFYPFYYIFIASISNPQSVTSTSIRFLPIQPTLSNFRKVLELNGIWRSFIVSLARTVIGTMVTLLFTSMLAFTLTQKELPCRKFFYRFAVVSMYINAGLIPWYLTMRSLHLKDSFLVYILPTALSAYCLVLVKTYIESIPTALEESARIDGAGYFSIYWKIILPVCMPILAAVIVFTAVGQWNSWTDNLLLVDDNNLRTLQLTLLEYLNRANNIASQARTGGAVVDGSNITPFTLRMTITMVVTLPILIVYPFMQKYFIKGIMIGAVKG